MSTSSRLAAVGATLLAGASACSADGTGVNPDFSHKVEAISSTGNGSESDDPTACARVLGLQTTTFSQIEQSTVGGNGSDAEPTSRLITLVTGAVDNSAPANGATAETHLGFRVSQDHGAYSTLAIGSGAGGPVIVHDGQEGGGDFAEQVILAVNPAGQAEVEQALRSSRIGVELLTIRTAPGFQGGDDVTSTCRQLFTLGTEAELKQ